MTTSDNKISALLYLTILAGVMIILTGVCSMSSGCVQERRLGLNGWPMARALDDQAAAL
jgi:hypothetical protein